MNKTFIFVTKHTCKKVVVSILLRYTSRLVYMYVFTVHFGALKVNPGTWKCISTSIKWRVFKGQLVRGQTHCKIGRANEPLAGLTVAWKAQVQWFQSTEDP